MTDHDLDLLVHRMFNHPPVIESFDQQCRQQVEMITQSLKIPTTIGEMFSRLRAIWRAGFREGAKTMERYRVEIAEQQAALDELKQRRAVVEKREQALDRKPKPEPTEAEMREFSRPCADCLHCSTPGDPAATCGHPRCLQIDPVTGVASRPRCVEVRQAGDRCGTRGHYFVPRATTDTPGP